MPGLQLGWQLLLLLAVGGLQGLHLHQVWVLSFIAYFALGGSKGNHVLAIGGGSTGNSL